MNATKPLDTRLRDVLQLVSIGFLGFVGTTLWGMNATLATLGTKMDATQDQVRTLDANQRTLIVNQRELIQRLSALEAALNK